MTIATAKSTAIIELPRFRRDQWDVIRHPAQIKVLAMGRRWGKTVLGGAAALGVAAAGGSVAWCAPQYKNTRPLWRVVERNLAHLQKRGLAKILISDRVVQFSNGGFLGIYSLDNPDSVLGERFHLVVVDEAARVKAEAWHEALLPTLADFGGSALLISTPKPGWYRDEWYRAVADGGDYMAAFTAPTSANPNPNIQQAFIKARERLPERIFRQEWLAEFVESSGQVFPRIREAVYGPAENSPAAGSGQFIIGVDLAMQQDYTVFTVLDIVRMRVVEIQRIQKILYSTQIERLAGLAERYDPLAIVVEQNSKEEVVQQMFERGLPIVPFVTSNASKTAIVNRLVLEFEKGNIEIPDDTDLIGELNSFEMFPLASGHMRYSAPHGLHDDMVMSLCFAVWGSDKAVAERRRRDALKPVSARGLFQNAGKRVKDRA